MELRLCINTLDRRQSSSSESGGQMIPHLTPKGQCTSVSWLTGTRCSLAVSEGNSGMMYQLVELRNSYSGIVNRKALLPLISGKRKIMSETQAECSWPMCNCGHNPPIHRQTVHSPLEGMWTRYGKHVMRIRIRPRDQWSRSRNSLKGEQVWLIVREQQRRVIHTEIVRSGSHADRPMHS